MCMVYNSCDEVGNAMYMVYNTCGKVGYAMRMVYRSCGDWVVLGDRLSRV